MRDGTTEDADEVQSERAHLLALTYRMLGTTAEAEDAVQETYLRWYRMTEAERAAIANPTGWLVRVASRVCLDVLASARHRRERYVGEWLPEPVPADLFLGTVPDDPHERAVVRESVGTALLVVMEAMTPAERVAFVLHDVFAHPFADVARIVGRSPAAVRQAAASARRRVRDHGADAVDVRAHDAVADAFARTAATGDLTVLTALLDPSVALRVDGGGVVNAARRPVLGASNVARFLLGVLGKDPDLHLVPARTGDGTAFRVVHRGPRGEQLRGVVNLSVAGGRVRDVWLQVNPDKLRTW